MKLVIGLGNPGQEYAKTRHNVGFEVLSELARRFGGTTPSVKHQAEIVDIFLNNEKVLLVAPQTFMNLSGQSVRKLVDFYQVEVSQLLVVCDDMNLPVGQLRLRGSGSAGGQNGLKDIINRLNTPEFPRLRIGIGRPHGKMDSSSHVLGKFRSEELPEIEIAILRAADAVEKWVTEGMESAMNRFNQSSS